jgi:hypothetical protein
MSRTAPAFKRRLGNVTVIAWRNFSDKGPWYSVEFSRGFKKDDGRHESSNFTLDDLPAQMVLNQTATKWILDQKEANQGEAAIRPSHGEVAKPGGPNRSRPFVRKTIFDLRL